MDGQIRDVAVLVAVGKGVGGWPPAGVGRGGSLGRAGSPLAAVLAVPGGARGVRGVQWIVGDDHAGLRAARQAVFGGVPWQRCQCHRQQNAQAYVPRKAMQAEVAARIREMFNAPNRAQAEQPLKAWVSEMEKRAPRLAQ